MVRDDWFRRTTWSRDDEEQFHARLSRCRSKSNKSQYVRTQAVTLHEYGFLQPALALLNRLLQEWPDRLQLASAHLELAECYAELGESGLAVNHFRAALFAEEAAPNVLTQVWLLFPWCVLSNQITSLYDEIDQIISSREQVRSRGFPLEIYRWAGARALLCEHHGDLASAIELATVAIDAANRNHSGFRYHADLGLVSKPSGRIHDRLVALASGKNIEIAESSRSYR